MRYDRTIVCSAEDRAALLTHSPGAEARIEVIPNGVDVDHFRPTPIPANPRLLFPGTLGYAPNVDAALWLCAEVWPRVRAACPGAQLGLVGRDPAPEVTALGTLAGVSVHANVRSTAPYYEDARTVVVPLRIGTGTRLKALEAMAAGRPVVGTSIGLEGLDITDREQALVANDAAGLASAVIESFSDDPLAARLAAAGRAHVEQRFGWDRISGDFVELVGEVLSEGT